MARDFGSIRRTLALGIAEREFGDLIARGVGSREDFANLFMAYADRHPGVTMGDAADYLRKELLQWLTSREGGRGRPTIRELPMG